MSTPNNKRYQICVSGAARGSSVEENYDLAFAAGRLIAERGHILLTGATIGLPYAAAKGAVAAGGKSVGVSPAASHHDHVKRYRLPTDAFDFILYTGLHYVGRDNLLISCSEAVMSIGGRMGTMHEFTTAMELHKPVGVVEGSGGSSKLVNELLLLSQSSSSDVVLESDPEKLIDELIRRLDVIHSQLDYDNSPRLGRRLA